MAEIPEKHFYKIGEVCQYTDTQPYVLRFWESEFPQLAPQKNRTGQRVYSRRDIDLIMTIKQLLYGEEYTIAGARKHLEGDLEEFFVPEAIQPSETKRKGSSRAKPSESGRTLQEIDSLRNRVADLEGRWRRAEEALGEIEKARSSDRERSKRVAARLESLVDALGSLEQVR